MKKVLEKYKGFIIDLDGVVYLDKKPLPYSKKFINKLPSKISFSIIGTKLSTLISKVHYFIKDQIFIIDDDENYKKGNNFEKCVIIQEIYILF